MINDSIKGKLARIAGVVGLSTAMIVGQPLAALADQTISDNLNVIGNIYTSGSLTVDGSATASGGLLVDGGAVSLNVNDQGDFSTVSIGTGNSNQGVYIGSDTNIVALESGTWGIDTSGNFRAVKSIASSANCGSTDSPASCGFSMTGSVALPVASTSLVVNNSAVTADSQIFVIEDASLSTRLGITCQATIPNRVYSITARNPGTSFTIRSSAAPITNKACLSFMIIN